MSDVREGVVLSHTKMWGDAFCTNVLHQVFDGRELQLRFRTTPSRDGGPTGKLHYSHFAPRYTRTHMLDWWQRGRVVQFPRPVKISNRRPTHPEDCYFDDPLGLGNIIITDQVLSTDDLLERISTITFNTLPELFTHIVHIGNGKWATEGSVKNERSVGYIRATGVMMYKDGNDKWVAIVTTADAGQFTAKVTGTTLIAQLDAGTHVKSVSHTNHHIVVRCALAGPWSPEDSDFTPKCFLMISDIICTPR